MDVRRAEMSLLLLLALIVGGCEPEVRVIRPSFASLREYADKPPAEVKDRDPTGGSGWSIPLASFTGEDRYAEAQHLYARLRSANLPELWHEDVGGTVTLYCGRFDSASDPDAQMTLRNVRNYQHDGESPFKNARMIPLVGGHRVKLDPLDLRQFAGFFTVQVAVFTQDYQGDRKAAAEKLARQLRADNEEAYYYHGPRNSSVCIGLFTWDDFERRGNIDVPGPRIQQIRQRHPFNVIDGHDPAADDATAETTEGAEGSQPQRQPSFVVRVI